MNLDELCSRSSPWLKGAGPHSDVVISCRVRLARNIAGYPFVCRANDHQCRDLLQTCRRHINELHTQPKIEWVDLGELSRLDRQLLVERHLISKQHGDAGAARGVAVGTDESLAIMVNEEDHLRMQVIRNGMQLDDAYAQANMIDDSLEMNLDFAYSQRLGYLTACPTNVGTGIRVSVMLHLPALKLTGEIEKVRRAARDMHMAVRGFYGEGTDAIGDFFQISNQTTLGRTEQEVLTDFQQEVIPQVIEYERRARRALMNERRRIVEDRVYRAWGVLTNARMLTSEETMRHLTYLRLGIGVELIHDVEPDAINEMMLLTQPAHLQKMMGRRLDGTERRAARADFIREHLTA